MRYLFLSSILSSFHYISASLPSRFLLSFFTMSLSFDLAEATRHLSAKDEKLAALIAETAQFQTDMDAAQPLQRPAWPCGRRN